MRLKKINIENFKAIKKGEIDCDEYNCFVGPNGSGKSTVLDALNVFFGTRNAFSDSDFHKKNTSKTAKIELTFSGFDESSKTDFSHYVRNGELVVAAEISADKNGKISRIVRGQRMVFEPFKKFSNQKAPRNRLPRGR